MPTPHQPSVAVRRALKQLGNDLREARLRRNLTMTIIADRAFTSRATLQRIEAGDPGVGVGIYAAVLNALGMLEGFGRLADPAHDRIGQALASAALRQRARPERPKWLEPEHS